MKNAADDVKAALRAKGFDVSGFYGSGDDPSLGWVRVWWSCPSGPRHGLNAFIDRLPDDPAKAKELKSAFEAAMAELGWVRRIKPGGDIRVWRKEKP